MPGENSHESPRRNSERGNGETQSLHQALSRALRVPATRIHAIVQGKRGISADTSARLGRYFGASLDFWLRVQTQYDLRALRSEKDCGRGDPGRLICCPHRTRAMTTSTGFVTPVAMIQLPLPTVLGTTNADGSDLKHC